MATTTEHTTTNLVVISDTHAGSRLGICPPTGVTLDEGVTPVLSPLQLTIWDYWQEFWKWVPKILRREKFDLLHNGDAIDGHHHNSVEQMTHNLADQAEIAYCLLAPVVAKAERYYHIRGTEAHVGPSGQDEERLAKRLGAVPNKLGQYARYDLWKQVGPGLVHALHHIGTTGSQAYEATAVHKELVESFTESARWGYRPPDIIIRSHRHRHFETMFTTVRGSARAVVTPSWQGKTPFVWRIPGGRLAPPQFGGVIIRWHPKDEVLYTREFVRSIGTPEVEA